MIMQSAKTIKILLRDANQVMNKISESPAFSKKLMEAAQTGKSSEVNRLIQTTGISSRADSSYTPDGLHIVIRPEEKELSCCILKIGLRWM
ncbi:hypothetical protein ABND49_05280 [Paenibacillus larvae]|nr:hypothetical protein BXP28_06445 [Paenibacillus larvae subsp. larvae]PCK71615.1 inner spore coat-like protein [Paenibacillus larvae subsp. larvae B-3650]